jgi:hypothetical protein
VNGRRELGRFNDEETALELVALIEAFIVR